MEYKPYAIKSARYGVMTNGIIFSVSPHKVRNSRYIRKEKYIPLCQECLEDTINFIEVLNDIRSKEEKENAKKSKGI